MNVCASDLVYSSIKGITNNYFLKHGQKNWIEYKKKLKKILNVLCFCKNVNSQL